MGFEFIYSLCIWLTFVAAGTAVQLWLERSETNQIAKYLKLQSSPQYIVGGIAWAVIVVFVIPIVFGYKFNANGHLSGVVIYIAWMWIWGKPKWQSLKDRVNREKMKERGHKGDRMADLRVRKLKDYVPRWLLAVPYLGLLAIGLYISFWVGTSLPSSSNLFFLLALGIGATLFLNGQMVALVRQPIDLRSSAPEDLIPKVHAFLKRRIRIILVFQIVYVVSLLASAGGYASMSLSPFWVFAGQAPFVVCALWVSISTTRGIAKLDEQRWPEGKQEPENEA